MFHIAFCKAHDRGTSFDDFPDLRLYLASRLCFADILAGLALLKEGMTEERYLRPLSSEHAINDYYGDQQKHLDTTKAEKEDEEDGEVEDADE